MQRRIMVEWKRRKRERVRVRKLMEMMTMVIESRHLEWGEFQDE